VKKIFSVFAVAAIFFCVSAARVKADGGSSGPDLYYTLTGGPADAPVVMTFALPVNPTIGGPDNYDPGIGFQIEPIDLTINGTPTDNDCLYFYTLFAGGAFQDFNGNVNLMNTPGSTVLLYSGDEWDPTMLLLSGPLALTDYDTGTLSYTLTNSTVPAPEPATLMLLASGIIGLGLALKFRTA
jgi:hypothetical protein